jgi:uncharacterized DUF497 family protein
MSKQDILFVVTVELDEGHTRIISTRKAEPHEQQIYLRLAGPR